MRALLARVLTDPGLFRLAVVAGCSPSRSRRCCASLGLKRLAADVRVVAAREAGAAGRAHRQGPSGAGERRGRVALLSGCISPVLAPSINEAAIRLLNRHGVEVVVAEGEACCGSLVHHMGREDAGACARRATISTPGPARSRATGSTPS